MSDINNIAASSVAEKLSVNDEDSSELHKHVVELENHIAQLTDNINEIKNSTSWRITAPLRKLKLLFLSSNAAEPASTVKPVSIRPLSIVEPAAEPIVSYVDVNAVAPAEAVNKKESGIYDQDGLRSIHNHEFMTNDKFISAYQRGVKAAGLDYQWHWRVHVGLWAAQCASKLSGDFVECGVNKGFLSSSIMQLLNWDSLAKTFYLLDTFKGIDERFITLTELDSGILDKNTELLDSGWYVNNSAEVRANFSEWKNVKVVEGVIPETLSEVKAEKIAYLHIDLNCAPPEVAALDCLWERIVPGGFILLDDYAYSGYREQKLAMDKLAVAKGFEIVSLPTGQGLIIKT